MSPATAAETGSSPISRSNDTVAPGPSIQGLPQASAKVGQAYKYTPTVVSSPSGSTLKFSITNQPKWLKFDSKTGTLSGTPSAAQVGQYSGIKISVTDGTDTNTTAPFSIIVAADSGTSAVTLSWTPPSENADGSPLVDLKGYKVHYGASSKTYTETVDLSNAGLTTYVVPDLTAGTYYFAVTAYNSVGQESLLSPEVSTQVD